MMIDANSIVINGVSMGQYLLTANFQYNKGWGKDTGRNLAGSWSGTLLGVFPKLVLTFRNLSESEVETLAPIFDSKSQNVRYYDPIAKEVIGISTYSGDWSLTNNNVLNNVQRANEGIQISFIAKGRRQV